MPIWIAYSLANSFVWSIVNILDTMVLGRYKLSPWTYMALDGILGILPVGIFFYISPLSISEKAIVFSLISGVFIGLFNILYFFSLNLSDVSVVVILIQLTPVFSLFWGLTFLGEKHSLINYLGMTLVLAGTIIASTSEGQFAKGKSIPKTLFASGLMLIAAFSVSIANLFQKIALNQNADVLIVFGWQRTSLFVISLLLMVVNKKKIVGLTFQPIALTAVVEIINILGFLFITFAYSLGSLSQVAFFSSLQPAWVLIILWIFQILKLNVISRSETISTRKVVLACGIVILGLYFLL